MAECPALLITAPGSGHGKTTLTAALARWHRRAGRRVQVFKTGPDFLDPMLLAQASGREVLSLDLWMVGAERCGQLLAAAAADAELILIEGVMGLYDGTPSSADLALHFDLPVLPVIQARGMAQSFAALAHGLASFRPGLRCHGVFANRVGSARHHQLLTQALPAELPCLGQLGADAAFEWGERHLGLRQADEIESLEQRLELAADRLDGQPITQLPAPQSFHASPPSRLPRLLAGQHIAIARDAAFAFIYPANLQLLSELGAQISFFSPLANEAPAAESTAIYLPGGYPELHAAELSQAQTTATAIRHLLQQGASLLAECGGMLYLFEQLIDSHACSHTMLGLLPGTAQMQSRLVGLGMLQLDTAAGCLTGHSFHYSRLETSLPAWQHASRPGDRSHTEAVYRHGRITASYMHAYWPSHPRLIASFFHGQAFY